MPKSWSILTPWEKMAVTFLTAILVVTGTHIGLAFRDQYSVVEPREGGLYTEGVVGRLGPINPLYTPFGSIGYDLSRLIFSGLTRYDPVTREIIPDLAEVQISRDKKQYTFVIRKDAKWHDGEPVTSQDVLFTYNDVIKNPEFSGTVLNYIDYGGLSVTAVDDRTVQFTLDQPDSFFPVKTMTAIVPKHILGPIAVKNIPLSEFSQSPVGSGPYRFVRSTPMDRYTEVSLESFPDYYGEKPHVHTLLIKVFSDISALLKKQSDLMAIYNVPVGEVPQVLKKGKLAIQRYQLPQYVAVFMNTESPILKNKKVRLALQLATDKKTLVESIGQTRIIDTPLLEIDQGNWVHQYSPKRANGALFETEWQVPDKAASPSPESAETRAVRRDKEGRFLRLSLITRDTPPDYARVAQILKDQWRSIGVDLNIEILTDEAFQARVDKRGYDLLLFGQNLGYNLDAYPYWHSTQAKPGGYNLSQLKNFAVDSLLEKARIEFTKEDRQKTLTEIQNIFSAEVPALFLYSPTYYFALSPQMQNVNLSNLAMGSDRFAQIHRWYARVKHTLKPETTVFTFLQWVLKQF